jgi:hypothetical protein
MNDVSIDELIKALWSEDAGNAIASIKAIGEAALPALLVALKKDDRNSEHAGYENGALRKAIIEIGEPAFQKLLEALAPGSNMVRAAAKTLDRWGDKRAVDYMTKSMLNDDVDLNGRCYIIEALGHFRDPKAFEPLKTALLHKDEFIRSHAARALAEYGDVDVLPSIFDALEHVNRGWWHGTTESIGEIVKIARKKCIEKGLEAEFVACLNQMESLHPEMVADYKEWIKNTPVELIIPGNIAGNGNAFIFLKGAKPDLAKIKGNAERKLFSVYPYGGGSSFLVNTTDSYEGTVKISSDTYGFSIKATGSWSIEVTAK